MLFDRGLQVFYTWIMGFTCGIVGLPNAGKSTVFNAITRAGAQVASYPFTTIDPNRGVVAVPDERLQRLADLIKPEKMTPTTLEFLDIAGLVKGASMGEGLGNQFLSHIRAVDAIAHIVRCFEDPDVAHIMGQVDPRRDIDIVNTELILADLETIERRIEKAERLVRGGDKKAGLDLKVCQFSKMALVEGKPVRTLHIDEGQEAILKGLNLLTAKPVIYVANVGEDDPLGESPLVEDIRRVALKEGAKVVAICGKVEAELAELEEGERGEYLKALGLKESGLSRLVRAGYELLGLITFYTFVGKKELRAWTVIKGTRAPQAGGVIHTDFERGFIKAEVISYEDLIYTGSDVAAREKGLVRLEGKEYTMKDGDVVHFRFAL